MPNFQELMGKALQARRTNGLTRSQAKTKRRAARPSLEAFEQRLLLSGMDLDPLRSAAVASIQAAAQRPRLSNVWGDIIPSQLKANLKARLTNADGSPIAGQAITFRIGMNVVGSARTNADGVASLNGVNLGNLPLRSYIARTIAVLPAGSGFPRTVTRGPLAMPRNDPTAMSAVLATGTYGGSAHYAATLTSNGAPVAGKAVNFWIGSQLVGTGSTNASGVASLDAGLASLGAGTYVISARFAGDAGSAPSSGDGTLSIARAAAPIAFGSLTTTYNGQPATFTTTTTPAGLPIAYSYTDANGHAVANPVHAGVYHVAASVADPNYVGSSTGSLTINPAVLGVAGLTAAGRAYDGTTHASINTTSATLTGVIAGDSVGLNTSSVTGAFQTKSAGVGKTVTISGLALNGPGAGDYVLPSITTTATINPRNLDVTGITAVNRDYDGTTVAQLNTEGAALSGVLPGDVVTVDPNASVGTFDGKDVSLNRFVTIDGLVLTGADAGNYAIGSSLIVPAEINPALLTLSGANADRPYDGTTVANISLSGAILSGVVGGETVLVDVAGVTAGFADRNVGADKPVTYSGLALQGADAANYTLVLPAITGTITPRTVYLDSPAIAYDKVYDGGDNAAVSVPWPTAISGLVAGDSAWIDPLVALTASGTFADKNAGPDKIVTIHGLNLIGVDAANYALAPVTATASITPAPLTVTGITAYDRTYDGTTVAALNTESVVLSGMVIGDTVGIDSNASVGAFADKNVGIGKVVTINGLVLDGDDASNYTLTPTTNTIATITPATLTVSGITTLDKVYDGTTNSAIDTSDVMDSGIVSGDDVTLDLSSATASFADKNVGEGKTVSFSGLSLTGLDAANYVIDAQTTTANITPRTLTLAGIIILPKVYDGTTNAVMMPMAPTLVGIVGSDFVTFGPFVAAEFADKNAGLNKVVTLPGAILVGPDAGNYTLDSTLHGDISQATLTVSGITAFDKVYDGTANAGLDTSLATFSGVLAGDTVGLDASSATGAFADKHVGTDKPVTVSGLGLVGDDAGNYAVLVTPVPATITPRALTITNLDVADKNYNGTTDALFTGNSNAVYTGLVTGDDVAPVPIIGTTANFDDKNVGNNKLVTFTGLALFGPDGGDYTIVSATGTASITKTNLLVSGITANKVYDGTTNATLDGSAVGFTGLVTGETATLVLDEAIASFADKNAGIGKAVSFSGISLGGSLDPNNYNVIFSPITGDVAKKTLTVTGITANDKIFDGTTNATINVAGAAFVGVVAGDDVTIITGPAIGTFQYPGNPLTPTLITVNITGVDLTGADADNYAVEQPTTAAFITP